MLPPGGLGQVYGRTFRFHRATLAARSATPHLGRRLGESDARYSHERQVRDDGAHGACVGNVTASVLLAIGYPVAIGVLVRLRPVLTERRVWWFAALEAATATITAGWVLHGRLLPAALNSAALVGFALAWLITGQRAGAAARKAR